jgi:hypothetical protein
MKKNEDRKIAEKTFLGDRGRITNKELAEKLGVHPATVARWKKIDEWDRKLVQSVTASQDTIHKEDDVFTTDLRHIAMLNERLENYLQKKELLPYEILELAEAKYRIMTCVEIIEDRIRFDSEDDLPDEDREFDL